MSKYLCEFQPSSIKNLCKFNILHNSIRIGVTNTKLHNKILNKNLKKRVSMIPIKKMASATDVSKLIEFLATDENSYITNEVLTIAGGE